MDPCERIAVEPAQFGRAVVLGPSADAEDQIQHLASGARGIGAQRRQPR